MLTALLIALLLWLISAIIILGGICWAIRIADREQLEFDARLTEAKTRIERDGQ